MRFTIGNFTISLPAVPVSAIILYIVVLLLWKNNALPTPEQILVFLEVLYEKSGPWALFFASLLEGLVYIGLYVPGSSIVLLSVILSNGGTMGLFKITAVVALALTVASACNYWLGRRLSRNSVSLRAKATLPNTNRGLLLSALHPNLLAFYFFNAGLNRRPAKELAFVPIIMIPYGFVLGLLLYTLKSPIREAAENPYTVIAILLLWLAIASIYSSKQHN